jgi:[ribosomal protein S5]-alanine N-acetyltransferase
MQATLPEEIIVLRMPPLETSRLIIRPFCMDDLQPVHDILDVELAAADFATEGAMSLQEWVAWLQWAVLNYEQLARLYQPPYGDRALVLKATGRLVGACGFVPSLGPLGQLPGLVAAGNSVQMSLYTPEFGLFYAVSPSFQRQGYASEAARAMADYAFQDFRLQRVVATTTYDNAASIRVMQKIGMTIERNPFPDPPWFQVVGILGNPVVQAP